MQHIFVPLIGVELDMKEEGQMRGCEIPNPHFQELLHCQQYSLPSEKRLSVYLYMFVGVFAHTCIMYSTRATQRHVDSLGKLINWRSFKST